VRYEAFTRDLANLLCDYLVGICLGEARHSASQSKIDDGYFIRGLRGESRSSAIGFVTRYNKSDAATATFLVFNKGIWSNAYGGQKWARIAAAALTKLRGTFPNPVFIDYGYDLNHNGGLCFDKGVLFCSNSNSQLKRFLTEKRLGPPKTWTYLKVTKSFLRFLQQAHALGLFPRLRCLTVVDGVTFVNHKPYLEGSEYTKNSYESKEEDSKRVISLWDNRYITVPDGDKKLEIYGRGNPSAIGTPAFILNGSEDRRRTILAYASLSDEESGRQRIKPGNIESIITSKLLGNLGLVEMPTVMNWTKKNYYSSDKYFGYGLEQLYDSWSMFPSKANPATSVEYFPFAYPKEDVFDAMFASRLRQNICSLYYTQHKSIAENVNDQDEFEDTLLEITEGECFWTEEPEHISNLLGETIVKLQDAVKEMAKEYEEEDDDEEEFDDYDDDEEDDDDDEEDDDSLGDDQDNFKTAKELQEYVNTKMQMHENKSPITISITDASEVGRKK